MTLSPEHVGYKNLLRCLILVLAEELNLPLKNLGSTTYQREDLERALEPDECWYIRNLSLIRGRRRIDLTRDPPPDLVVEIDVTHSSLDRLSIYAALGVGEVWRFDGENLRVYCRGSEGRYEESDYSPTFPAVPVADLIRFVRQGEAEDDTSMVWAFRVWVRELLAKPSSRTAPQPEEG